MAIVTVMFYQSGETYSGSVVQKVPESIESVMYQPPVALAKFRLTTQGDNEFTVASFKDYWTFLFFGYTHCPDICPATMSQLVNIKNLVEKDESISNNVQVVFVSVDPARDTPGHLAQYVKYFDKSFIAVTGDISNLNLLEEQLGVFHRYGNEDADGNYRVDHTTDIFLVDPVGIVTAKFQVPLNIRQVAEQYVSIQQLHDYHIM